MTVSSSAMAHFVAWDSLGTWPWFFTFWPWNDTTSCLCHG